MTNLSYCFFRNSDEDFVIVILLFLISKIIDIRRIVILLYWRNIKFYL